MKDKLFVVKIGGHVIDDREKLDNFLAMFASLDRPRILVHGGGKLATALGEKMGIPAEMVGGRRITSDETLDLVTMVYAGLVNKKICARLQKFNCNAIGLSGCDADTIRAVKRPAGTIDYGWAGDIQKVDPEPIGKLIGMGFVPVFSPITHNGSGQLLNTNADTIAAEIAIAMSRIYAPELIYCFEKRGVLKDIRDEGSVIEFMDPKTYRALKEQYLIHTGMLPKLDNSFHALKNGVSKVRIGHFNLLGNFAKTHTTITN